MKPTAGNGLITKANLMIHQPYFSESSIFTHCVQSIVNTSQRTRIFLWPKGKDKVWQPTFSLRISSLPTQLIQPCYAKTSKMINLWLKRTICLLSQPCCAKTSKMIILWLNWTICLLSYFFCGCLLEVLRLQIQKAAMYSLGHIYN